MAGRRSPVTDIREILRRLQVGEPDRRIARDLGVSRNTVARYRVWAGRHGVLNGGPLPDPAALAGLLAPVPTERPAHEQSLVEPWRERVLALHERGVEGQAIWQLLVEEHGFTGSYSSVKRFLRRLAPGRSRATLRLEVSPGEEAQVDFGYAGQLLDPESGRVRRAWVFVMTLSCSRHQYAELVFEQTIETWLRLHRAAFEFFGGVPRRVVLDNLRAAIVHAARYDPEVQRSYRECAEHYGFLIAPCRPRTPEHKGKVEQGGVHYVKRNALAGRAFRDVHDGNRHLLRWCLEIAGRRIHGTTKEIPLAIFDQLERAALLPLPLSPWELAEWKQAKLHADCHVVFGGAYYSAPHRLIGERLWVRAAGSKIELFHDYTLIATHRRARPGQRRTVVAHLPPEKVHFLMQTPAWCRARAAEIGPACALFIDALLGDRPLDRLRSAQGVLRFVDRYGAERVDAACARAHAVGEYRYHTIKAILVHALDRQPLPGLPPVATAPAITPPRHARPWTTFFPDPESEDRRSLAWN
ncbi:MAG: IS21 family transposase [Candidatus Rokuibacteriota bacterium]|nr:MAG: IS21 family transposase [Candidatus Rokubacteria bacterium]